MNIEPDAKPPAVVHPVVKFKQQFDERRHEFAGALPAHIPFERFARVIQTAVAQNVALLNADRATLFTSAMKSATDGLLCDGREAALVIYRTKKKDPKGREVWVDAVQYMPMVSGILKKCRNSGQLSSIVARVVYAGDKFRNWVDDNGEHLEYEAGEDQDRNIVRNCFAMAKLKDGSIEVEVLKPADIEKIRSVSRAKDKGPWVEWWEEMAKKSAIRRLSKRLPINTDLDDLIRRDDNLYDLEGARDEARAANGGRLSLAGKLDLLAEDPPSPEATTAETETIEHDPQTGEIQESGAPADPPGEVEGDGSPSASDTGAAIPPAAPVSTNTDLDRVRAGGDAAAKEGKASLDIFLMNLEPDDAALVTPALRRLWAATASIAGKGKTK
jgi:recombination protein RecT